MINNLVVPPIKLIPADNKQFKAAFSFVVISTPSLKNNVPTSFQL